MVYQVDESDNSSKYPSLITVWCADDGSAATNGSAPMGPISKRLVSSDYGPARQIELIREMLANRDEQQAAKCMEPEEASKFVEILDLVRLLLSSPSPMSHGK